MKSISFLNGLQFLFLAILLSTTTILADDTSESDTCVFDDGIVYDEGENLGTSFESRCGAGTEYPCFCAPTDPFQAFCPYCGFSAGDGTLYCARDGETIRFQDGSVFRLCSCQFTSDDITVEPLRNCTVEGGSGFDGQCELPDAEGNLVQFENGESFGDLIEGACGSASEWPSFCRVTDEAGNFDIAYPYCVFNDVSFDESQTGILCARDGQTIVYIDEDNVEQTCVCTVSPEGDAFESCTQAPTVSPAPTTVETTPAPTPAPTFAPINPASAFSRRAMGGVLTMGIIYGIVSVLV